MFSNSIKNENKKLWNSEREYPQECNIKEKEQFWKGIYNIVYLILKIIGIIFKFSIITRLYLCTIIKPILEDIRFGKKKSEF